jgi:hypothetical protein
LFATRRANNRKPLYDLQVLGRASECPEEIVGDAIIVGLEIDRIKASIKYSQFIGILKVNDLDLTSIINQNLGNHEVKRDLGDYCKFPEQDPIVLSQED